MKLLLALTTMLTSGCASLGHSEWGPRDTVLEVGFQVLNALDSYTTQRIRETPSIEEVEPITRAILGAKPEPKETMVYFATLGLTHYLISRALPPRMRRYWQSGTIAYSASMVKRNCELGLCAPKPRIVVRVFCNGAPC